MNVVGELGNNSVSNAPTPVTVNYPTGVTADSLSAGLVDAYSIGSNGLLYSWGDNTAGALGSGSYSPSFNDGAPSLSVVALPTGVHATAAAGGNDLGYAIGSDGKVYAWGSNVGDALGPNTVPVVNNDGSGDTDKPMNVPLPAGVTATSITAGYDDGYAIGSDGNIYAWGSNSNGQLGNASVTGTESATPVVVQLPATVAPVSISAGRDFAMAVGSDGNIYAWGANGDGQLGDPNICTTTCPDSSTPVQVQLPIGAVPQSVDAGYASSYAIASGSLYSWGDNLDGALGVGHSGGYSTVPTAVTLAAGVAPVEVTGANDTAYAIGTDGRLYAWGNGASDAIGNGVNAAANPSPVAVNGPWGTSTPLSGIAAGANSGYLLPTSLTFVSGGSATMYAGQPNTAEVSMTGYSLSGTPVITETGTLPAGVTFTDNGNATGTFSGTPTCASAGVYHVTIEANDGVDAPVVQPITITVRVLAGAAQFTSPLNDTVVAGQAMTPYLVTTTNNGCMPVPAVGVGGLPSGLHFTNNGNGTATIYGTPKPTEGGIYTNIKVGTKVVYGGRAYTNIQYFTLTINEPPVFTSAAGFTVNAGSAENFLVKTDSYPTATLAITSGTLPDWLTFTPNGTGGATIVGTAPATGGQWTVGITATNAYGSPTQTFTIEDYQLPFITSANNLTLPNNVAITSPFQVTAVGYPPPKITESGALPAGVRFSGGFLVGKPAAGTQGTYTVSFIATNKASRTVVNTYTQTFTLTID